MALQGINLKLRRSTSWDILSVGPPQPLTIGLTDMGFLCIFLRKYNCWARARARVMARVGLGVWPRWLGFTMADPTPLCNGEKAYFTRLWVPLTERSQLSTTARKKLLLCIISTRLTM